MSDYSNEFDSGYLTSLSNLYRSTQLLNRGPNRWLARMVPYRLRSPDGVDGSYVLICKSGLSVGREHEDLCFLYRFVSLLGEEPSDSTCIVNVVGQVTINVPSLTCKDGRLADTMGDWEDFWFPLKEAMCELKRDADQPEALLPAHKAVDSSAEEASSTSAYVERVISSKSLLQEAVEKSCGVIQSNRITDLFSAIVLKSSEKEGFGTS